MLLGGRRGELRERELYRPDIGDMCLVVVKLYDFDAIPAGLISGTLFVSPDLSTPYGLQTASGSGHNLTLAVTRK